MKKEYVFSQGKQGAVVPAPSGKTRITIRLDNEVLDWFRFQVETAGGGNYQSLINQALRDHIAQRQEPLEETLRRVLREEMSDIVANASTAPRKPVVDNLYNQKEDICILADGEPSYSTGEE